MNPHIILTAEDTLVALAIDAECPPGDSIGSEAELRLQLKDWPLRRLVGLWNRLPDARPVSRFENRDIAISRIWRVLHPTSPSARKPSKPRKPKKPLKSPKPGSKTEAILTLLRQPGGATLEALMAISGWQGHSIRGFLSNLKRVSGLNVGSRKSSGHRTYRLSR